MLSLEQLRDAIHALFKARACTCSAAGQSYCNHGSQCPCCLAGTCCCSGCYYIVATFADSVIICNGSTRLFRHSVAVDKANVVTLGEPEPVEVVYQKLLEGLTAGDAHAVFGGGRILGPLVDEKQTEGEKVDKVGSRWAAVAIQAGVSSNRNYYSDDVLRAAAPLYEGAKVFINHEMNQNVMRSPNDIVGRFRNAKYGLIEGKDGTRVGAVMGELVITVKAQRERMLEAWEAGEGDLYGLSHTAHTEADYVKLADGAAFGIKKIKAVESLDIVSFPSAGGRLLRLVAGLSSPVPVTEEGLVNFEQKLKKVQESRFAGALSATPSETEVNALLRALEAEVSVPAAPAVAAAPAPATTTPAPVAPAPTTTVVEARLSDSDRRTLDFVAQQQRTLIVEGALAGVNLPAPLREELREGLIGQADLTPETAKAAVEKKIAVAARVIESIRGIGFGQGVVIEGGSDASEKVINLLDDLFMTDAKPEVLKAYEGIAGRKAGRPDTHSYREAYTRITGDQSPWGRPKTREGLIPLSRYDSVMAKRTVEGRRVVEGLLQTTTWAEILGDSMGRRMLAEYRGSSDSQAWRALASVESPNDFKDQKLIRWGGYGDLPAVAQAGTYQDATTPGDEQATYAVTKRGYVESVTWEALVNDDLGQIRAIPVRMGRAAARTLYKFVTMTNLASNPTLGYDSVALFHAASHGNLTTDQLSAAAAIAGMNAMMLQTDMSGNETLSLTASWLMVPVALREMGRRLTGLDRYPLDARDATEANTVRDLGLNTLIVNPYMTDTDQWIIGADKGDCPLQVIGFLFGQEEPTLVIADLQNAGDLFAADTYKYKLRHVYSGAAVDHRGVYAGIPA